VTDFEELVGVSQYVCVVVFLAESCCNCFRSY